MKPGPTPRLVRLARWAGQYVGAVLIIVFWELYVRAGWIDPYLLPAPSAIIERGIEQAIAGDLVLFTALTMYRGIAGFLIAAALGVTIGILAARNAVCRWFFDPLVSIGFPAPKIAFMPIFVLWFGFDDASKLMMIVATCIFPIISATFLGATSIDRYFVWSARNLGMSERRVLWEVVIPAALPQILSGFQIAFPMALVLAVVTEMITGGAGLGGYMMRSARFAQSEQMFVGLVTIAVMGFLLLMLFDRLRRYLLRPCVERRGVVVLATQPQVAPARGRDDRRIAPRLAFCFVGVGDTQRGVARAQRLVHVARKPGGMAKLDRRFPSGRQQREEVHEAWQILLHVGRQLHQRGPQPLAQRGGGAQEVRHLVAHVLEALEVRDLLRRLEHEAEAGGHLLRPLQ